ncbi:MAG: hypothetical protein WKF30_13310 [Pyrinomonadaceae bacterium]
MQEFYNEQIFTVSAKEDDPIEALVRRGAKVMLEAALEQKCRSIWSAPGIKATTKPSFAAIATALLKAQSPLAVAPSRSRLRESLICHRSQEGLPDRRGLSASFQDIGTGLSEAFIEGLATRDFKRPCDV